MGAQAPQPSGGSNSARRAKPFVMDDQTRFLYLILKQLDLKIVNWQQVADDLGIKNGHAARMRWSRFRGHVEGAHAANNKKKDERKSNGVNAKNPMATKRIGIEPGQDEENDSKRVKTEQGWASVPGAYGQPPPPPPPPPYYPVDPSYGMIAAHPPSFGTVPLPHFGLQPHAGFQPQALSQNFGPALLPTGSLNCDNMIHSGVPTLVKPEPGSPPSPQPTANVRDEPRDEHCSNDEPCTVMVKVEKGRDSLEPARSSSTIDREPLQRNHTPKPEAASALPDASDLAGPSATGDDATCTTTNDQQYIKSEQESPDDTSPEARPLVPEVSKEDFTKAAVGVDASTHAPVTDSQKAGSPRQEEPSSPEIPLATIKAQALRQQAASVEALSSTQVQSVASDTVARAESDELSGRVTPAPSKLPQSTPAANVSGHQSPPSSYGDSLPPPMKAFSPKGSAPSIPMAASSSAIAQHIYPPPPYILPHGGYFHPHFPNNQTPHPLSHTYWPHPPIMHMNNSSPSPYPLPHPPLSAPPTMMPDWNDSAYHFGNPVYQPAAASTAAHDYGRQTMSAPASQMNFNLGPLITMNASQEQDRATPVTAAIDIRNVGSGLKTTTTDNAANMDMFGGSIEDFDPLGFDFRLGKDPGTGMSLRMERGPMEPQYVQPASEANGNNEHGERESGKEDSGGNEKENDGGEMGEKASSRVL